MTSTRKQGSTDKRYITALAAQERLDVSRRTLYQWGADGTLTVYKVGGRNRYDVAELDALIVRRAA